MGNGQTMSKKAMALCVTKVVQNITVNGQMANDMARANLFLKIKQSIQVNGKMMCLQEILKSSI